MGETISTPCQRLQEADQAYHNLMMGGAIARVVDENGEMIAYTKADAEALMSYIRMLMPLCPTYIPTAVAAQPKPLRFLF